MLWVSEELRVQLCQGVQPDTSHGTQTHCCSQAVRPLGSCERHRQKPKLLLVICPAVLAGCGGFCSALGLRFSLHQASGGAESRLAHREREDRDAHSCASIEGVEKEVQQAAHRGQACTASRSTEVPQALSCHPMLVLQQR